MIEPGTQLATYKIIELLASGGMGQVYVAEDTRLERRIALKMLPADMAKDPERLERFEREAKVVASLNHPNIVTIHSVEDAEGPDGERLHFLTMELVEGQTLDKVIPPGGLTIDRFFDFAVPLADAVGGAHQKGITHRDLKPGNVMVMADGRIKVLDFGLAKLAEPSAPIDITHESAATAVTMAAALLRPGSRNDAAEHRGVRERGGPLPGRFRLAQQRRVEVLRAGAVRQNHRSLRGASTSRHAVPAGLLQYRDGLREQQRMRPRLRAHPRLRAATARLPLRLPRSGIDRDALRPHRRSVVGAGHIRRECRSGRTGGGYSTETSASYFICSSTSSTKRWRPTRSSLNPAARWRATSPTPGTGRLWQRTEATTRKRWRQASRSRNRFLIRARKRSPCGRTSQVSTCRQGTLWRLWQPQNGRARWPNVLEDTTYVAALTPIAQVRADRSVAARTAAQQHERLSTQLPNPSARRRELLVTAEIALSRGDVDEAIEQLQTATDLVPPGADFPSSDDLVEYSYALAAAHYAAGNFVEAADLFRTVTDVGPRRVLHPFEYVRSFYYLGKIAAEDGDDAAARRYYARFLEYWGDGEIDRERVDEARAFVEGA